MLIKYGKNFLFLKPALTCFTCCFSKTFQGSAFYSKPDVLVFKDFDIGKSYKKKILLTNVSYSQTYCKFVGISDNLKDFLEIK